MNTFFRIAAAVVSLLARITGMTAGLRSLAEERNCISRGGAEDWADARPSRTPAAFILLFHRAIISFFIALIIFSVSSSAFGAPAGTNIDNTASAAYTVGGASRVSLSNFLRITTVATRTPAVLEFLAYAPASPAAVPTTVSAAEYSTSGTSGGPFVPLPSPTANGVPLNLSSPIPLIPGVLYHAGAPLFVRLTDLDQNLDPAVAETVLVTLVVNGGEREVLRLHETGPNTGVFTGAIQTGAGPFVMGNGVLNVVPGVAIQGSYVDIADATDFRTASALVDPYGIVLNAATGQPVNGATVTLINAATNNPATVFGDDGVSSFPAVVISGGTASDSGGAIYAFPAGGYRFPYVFPGNYRLVVTPPSGYAAPSQASDAAIQALPGAPFALQTPGSRGEVFIINPGPIVHIDLPLDPFAKQVYLIKTASKDTAPIGDFIQYRISVENTDSVAPIAAVFVNDRLPAGFRFRKGSARVGGVPSPDPSISGDGRTLTFPLGDLAPSAKLDITYVAEVGVGARLGKATNTATAVTSALGAVSNTTSVTVLVTEDLFRSKATIVGSVLAGDCGTSGTAESKGLAGVRIFLEDGTYVVTDKNGMYHFEAVKQGTHVVQLDLESAPEKYELAACEENTRFAGSTFSQFVDVQGGTLWRADFHARLKPKTVGEIGLELRSVLTANPSDKPMGKDQRGISYAAPIHVGAVPGQNLRLTVMLPEGAAYVPGTSKLNGAMIPDPELSGNALTFRLGDAQADWEGTVLFNARIAASGAPGDLITKGYLAADTPQAKNARTPVVENVLARVVRERQVSVPQLVLHPNFATLKAELTPGIKKQLDGVVRDLRKLVVDHIIVTGHTDSQRIHGQAVKQFADNYVLSRARAEAVGQYIAAALNLSPSQIEIIGKGPDEPVAGNETEEGRLQNRRVELRLESRRIIKTTVFSNEKDSSGMKAVAVEGLRPGEEPPTVQETAPKIDNKTMPDYNAAWLQTAAPGFAWLWPPENFHPLLPSAKAAIKHEPTQKVKLLLNGEPIDPLSYEGTLKRQDNKAAVSLWRGINLVEGDNRLEVLVTDETGTVLQRVERVVHYSGAPVKAVLVPEKSRLNADGKKPPRLAVRFTDKDGHPAREGTIGEYSIDPPRLPKKRVENLQQTPLTAPTTERLQYELGDDGLTYIELEPTTASGDTIVRVPLANNTQELHAWLKPEDRDWILVGLAEGTAGYNTVSGNMESFGASEGKDGFDENGRLAFYAKGKVKGEWLLTLAYDSAKANSDGHQSLYQTVDPNKYYTLYGDATEQRFDASSAKKLYVKLERDQFYALFGDYQTGLSVTELSRYNRSLTGLKSELKGKHGDFTVFASETNQAFVKDELRGDGTSGLYRLSRKNIVLNSETLTIETRDRFRSEVIVSTQQMIRYLDYTIDYEAGTIFFKSPVFSRDGSFNPVYIVANYESFDSGDTSYNYGGRGALRFFDDKIELGATHVHEGAMNSSGDLNGADLTVKLDEKTKLRAEVAQTKTDQSGETKEGSAYLAELTRRSEQAEGRAYIREQSAGFGLGQQNGSETGTRKTGFDIRYRMGGPWSLGAEAFRQENLSTGAVRDMAELRGLYTQKGMETYAGLRHAEDVFGDGISQRSEQVFAGTRYQLTERLSGRIEHSQSLSENDNSDFPTRTLTGLDYKLDAKTTLYADHEFTHGSSLDTETSRIGLKTTPWAGGLIGSSVEQQTTESGMRRFSTMGLKQTWQATSRWTLDAGLDRTATIDRTDSASGSGSARTFNTNVPPASGGEDFTAVFLGAGYKQETWSWTGRVEDRHSTSEDKVGVLMGANGEPRSGTGLAAGLQYFRHDYATGSEQQSGDLRLGYAYRPRETRWIILDRADYLVGRQTGGGFDYDNARIVNNFVANYKSDRKTQVSLLYGAKYVVDTIDGQEYRGYTDLAGLEGRYDITKTWDLGLRGLMLRSWALHQTQYGAGMSVGFNMVKNFWISVGYNFTGFRDKDFSQSDFTSEGPFVKFRIKFDQLTARDAIRWFTGQ